MVLRLPRIRLQYSNVMHSQRIVGERCAAKKRRNTKGIVALVVRISIKFFKSSRLQSFSCTKLILLGSLTQIIYFIFIFIIFFFLYLQSPSMKINHENNTISKMIHKSLKEHKQVYKYHLVSVEINIFHHRQILFSLI